MGARERWLRMPTVTLHSENDGWAYVRKGAQANDTQMTWQQACRAYPNHARDLLTEMEAILNREHRGE